MNKMLSHLVGYGIAADFLGGDGNLAAKAAFVATPFLITAACAKGAADGAAVYAARLSMLPPPPPPSVTYKRPLLALGAGGG